jgi:hypothetical protein
MSGVFVGSPNGKRFHVIKNIFGYTKVRYMGIKPKFGSCGSENGASTQNHFGF